MEQDSGSDAVPAFHGRRCVPFIILLSGLGLAIVITVLLLVWHFSRRHNSSSIAAGCVTEDCRRYAEDLLGGIDSRFDPCEDIQKYVCGRLPPVPKSDVISTLIFRRAITEDVPRANQTAYQKAARLLQTCVDVVQKGQTSVEPLKRLMAKIGLFWPDPTTTDFIQLLLVVSLNWDVHVWADITADPTKKDARENTMLAFSESPTAKSWLEKKSQIMKYLQYDQFVSTHLLAFGVSEQDLPRYLDLVKRGDAFVESNLTGAANGEVGEELIEFWRLSTGRRIVSALNAHVAWLGGRYALYGGIWVTNKSLFQKIFEEITGNPDEEHLLKFHLGWTVARSLGSAVSRDLAMLQYFEFERAVFQHEMTCFVSARRMLGLGLITPYAHELRHRGVQREVLRITDSIQESFIDAGESSSALDTAALSRLKNFLQGIHVDVFVPDQITSENVTNDIFTVVPDVVEDLFIENWAVTKEALKNASLPPALTDFSYEHPLYYPDRQTFFVPLGAIESPMYSISLTPAFNYGGLGQFVSSVFGVALYWEDLRWLTSLPLDIYNRRLDCFQRSADMYEDKTEETITRKQIMSAAWSLLPLYNAFKNASAGTSSNLQEAPNWSDDQLFFLAYCHSFCKTEAFRSVSWFCSVLLRNFPRFSEAFDCKRRTYMNPAERCLTW
ncbi:neprilysin-1-like isoform X2 [Ornithodoros turicata]|uniref:neprilysin-1-like isoform X2 n=1 Tax=Ornithodoros turicata TaxID=34597 RepID=UPI003138F9A2